MFCKNCGSKLIDNALFCANCGSKVDETYSHSGETQAAPSGPARCWTVFAKVSKILGIVSFCLSFVPIIGLYAILPGIPGIVFGALGRKAMEGEGFENSKKGLTFSIWGSVLGVLFFIVWFLALV